MAQTDVTLRTGERRGVAPAAQIVKTRKNWQMAVARFRHNPGAMIGLVIALVSIVIALIAPKIVPYDPTDTDFVNINAWPSRDHLFGTDASGSDIFSIALSALRTSYIVAFIVILISITVGFTVGMVGRVFSRLGGCHLFTGDGCPVRVPEHHRGDAHYRHLRRGDVQAVWPGRAALPRSLSGSHSSTG